MRPDTPENHAASGLETRPAAPPCPDQAPDAPPGQAFSGNWLAFVMATSDFCVEVDFEGCILAVNPAMERALGHRAEEIQGRRIMDFIHPEDLRRTREVLQGISHPEKPATGPEGGFENRYRKREGGYIWLSWSWLTDPAAKRVYGVARDVTETKRLQARQELMMRRLRRSNEDLANFASVASHDLREPLRMITSYLKLLEQRAPDALDEKGRRYIRYACEGAERMRRLIRDLLAYSRIEDKPITPEPVDLAALIDNVRTDLRHAIKTKGAQIEIDLAGRPFVAGDPIRLARLFQNLLANAIKFQPPGRIPAVRVEATAETGPTGRQGWRIAVRDNGIGIEADHSDLLFQLFRRLHPHDEYEGSGIGLAVCKRVVDMHEGRIWFESDPGRGSTFFVWLKTPPSDR